MIYCHPYFSTDNSYCTSFLTFFISGRTGAFEQNSPSSCGEARRQSLPRGRTQRRLRSSGEHARRSGRNMTKCSSDIKHTVRHDAIRQEFPQDGHRSPGEPSTQHLSNTTTQQTIRPLNLDQRNCD